ncbi:MAG: CapA family protein [Isosphaeraceae bacterium]
MDVVVGNLECAVATSAGRRTRTTPIGPTPRPPAARRLLRRRLAGQQPLRRLRQGAFVEGLEWPRAVGHRPLRRRSRSRALRRIGPGPGAGAAHRPAGLQRVPAQRLHAGRHTPGVAWSKGRERRVLADIAAARSLYHADVVIPFMHWGVEDVPGAQRPPTLAGLSHDRRRRLGGRRRHPHIPQGIETYRDRPIAYSLGNFVFDQYEDRPGWILSLTLDRSGVAAWETLVIRTDAVGLPGIAPEPRGPGGIAHREPVESTK